MRTGKTILVVEDEPSTARLLVRTLAAEGYAAFSCGDGLDAWETALRRVPDAVLLDVELPGLGGMDLCRRLRHNPATRHIPILMITGHGSVEDQIYGLDGGADDYLIKPFNIRELRARVAGLLRRCAPTPHEASVPGTTEDAPGPETEGPSGAQEPRS